MDLLLKFTPQRSYVFIEVPIKGKISLNPFPSSIDHKDQYLSHLLKISHKEWVIQTLQGAHNEGAIQGRCLTV